MVEIITILTQDKVVFWLIQIALVAITLIGVIKEHGNKQSGRIVKRGDKSKNILYIAYGIISVVLLQLISVSKAAEGYKIFFTILDLILVFYLCFFNSWSRNKIMGIYVKFDTKIENV